MLRHQFLYKSGRHSSFIDARQLQGRSSSPPLFRGEPARVSLAGTAITDGLALEIVREKPVGIPACTRSCSLKIVEADSVVKTNPRFPSQR